MQLLQCMYDQPTMHASSDAQHRLCQVNSVPSRALAPSLLPWTICMWLTQLIRVQASQSKSPHQSRSLIAVRCSSTSSVLRTLNSRPSDSLTMPTCRIAARLLKDLPQFVPRPTLVAESILCPLIAPRSAGCSGHGSPHIYGAQLNSTQ